MDIQKTGLILLASCLLWGCRHIDNKPQARAELKASDIDNAPLGNSQRCGIIYPDIYQKSLLFYKIMFDRLNDSSLSLTSKAQTVAERNHQMVLNMTRSPDRPIHPAALYALIKDFETSTDLDEWATTQLEYTTNNCAKTLGLNPTGLCHGYFQVDILVEPTWDNQAICGPNGLGFLGYEGGPDFCSVFWWWTMAQGGDKCVRMKENNGWAGDVSLNHHEGRRYVCNDILNMTWEEKAKVNPCSAKDYTWTTDTFSYGFECAYVQANQWYWYGIYDSWRKAYTGFRYDNSFQPLDGSITVHGDWIQGYEYCAVKHYVDGHYKMGTPNYPEFTPESIPSQLLREAVSQFGREIGVPPVWADTVKNPLVVSPQVQKNIRSYNQQWQENNPDTSPWIAGDSPPYAHTIPSKPWSPGSTSEPPLSTKQEPSSIPEVVYNPANSPSLELKYVACKIMTPIASVYRDPQKTDAVNPNETSAYTKGKEVILPENFYTSDTGLIQLVNKLWIDAKDLDFPCRSAS